MAEGDLPEPGVGTLLHAAAATAGVQPIVPAATIATDDADVRPPVPGAADRRETGSTSAMERIEEHLDAIDSRLRMLEDRFDDMVAELRTLGSDLTDQTNRQQHNATKEWITWAVVTILVVILGAMWWVFKIYILPSHHQVM